MEIHGVQPEELTAIFPLATPWLYRIPRLTDRYRLTDVFEELLSGRWQLWIALDDRIHCVLITTIQEYPLGREFVLIGIAGEEMVRWKKHIEVLEAYARSRDCKSVLMLGARKGFGKVFEDYDNSRVVLEKKL